MITELKVPTIHWNGTSKRQLEQEYRRAVDALRAAIKACQDVTVHGRDFYVQTDPEATSAAIRQQAWRLDMLQKVLEEYQQIEVGIWDQKGAGE